MNPVVIVGGGVSGLAAATELTERGVPVTLLEQKPRLGGRAYSFKDPGTGDTIDNGQHVLVAACERTFAFLDRIGTANLLAVRSTPEFVFHHPERGFRTLRFPALPAPLHLAAGLLASPLFSIPERVSLLRAGLALRNESDERAAPLTVAQWLDRHGQSAESRRSFWEPLAVSVLNEHCERASALVFLRSLRQAFLGGRRNAALALPAVGLSELYVDAAASLIRRRGGVIRRSAHVISLESHHDAVTRVRLKDGSAVSCSAVVLAVPPFEAAELLPPGLRRTGLLSAIAAAPASPIISIHLWLDTSVMRHDVIGIIGRRVQWLFKHARHLSAVISAAREFVHLSNDQLIALALEDLRAAGVVPRGSPRHAIVIREKRATFSCTPETERMRPAAETPIRNLFLAGDWTRTGLPATIEGAVVSAERAAALAFQIANGDITSCSKTS